MSEKGQILTSPCWPGEWDCASWEVMISKFLNVSTNPLAFFFKKIVFCLDQKAMWLL